MCPRLLSPRHLHILCWRSQGVAHFAAGDAVLYDAVLYCSTRDPIVGPQHSYAPSVRETVISTLFAFLHARPKGCSAPRRRRPFHGMNECLRCIVIFCARTYIHRIPVQNTGTCAGKMPRLNAVMVDLCHDYSIFCDGIRHVCSRPRSLNCRS